MTKIMRSTLTTIALIVFFVQQSDGQISGGFEVSKARDVVTSKPIKNGDALVWNSTIGKWTNAVSTQQSNVFYVSVTGSDSNPGTIGAPLATLQQALTNAGNGNSLIIVQPGTYNVTVHTNPALAPIQCVRKTNLTISAYGATFMGTTNYGGFMRIRDCVNVALLGARFTQPSKPEMPADPDATYSFYLVASVGIPGTNRFLRFVDCAFENFADHGIAHIEGGSTYKANDTIFVQNCVFTNGGAFISLSGGAQYVFDGVAIALNGRNFLVEGCKFFDCYRGVELEGMDWNPDGGQNMVRNCVFERVRDIAIMAFDTQTVSTNFQNFTIIGNVIRGASNGMILYGLRGTIISGNIVEGIYDGIPYGVGIVVNGATYSKAARDIIISGNKVARFDTGIGAGSITATNVIVSDNMVFDCRSKPISVWADAHISGNKIVAGTNGGSPFCLFLAGSSGYPCRPVVIGNTFSSVAGNAQGIYLANSYVTNAVIIDNSYIGTNADFLMVNASAGSRPAIYSAIWPRPQLGGSANATYGGSNTFWDVYARTNVVIGPAFFSNTVALGNSSSQPTIYVGTTSSPSFSANNGSIYLSTLGEMWVRQTNWTRK